MGGYVLPADRPSAADAEAATAASRGETRACEWLVGSLCGLHQIPFDVELLRQRLPGPYEPGALGPLLAHYGLTATTVQASDIGRCNGSACVAVLKADQSGQARRPVLVLAITAERVTYYQCGSVWYNQVYYQDQVQYVEISAPKGAEITSLSNPKTIEANGKTYYISEHTFYEKIKRDGKDIYVVVDPPYGVEVDSIPEKSVEVKVEGTTYYQYDKIFYRKISEGKKTTYLIVASPYQKAKPAEEKKE
jgi:hypothetical protein